MDLMTVSDCPFCDMLKSLQSELIRVRVKNQETGEDEIVCFTQEEYDAMVVMLKLTGDMP